MELTVLGDDELSSDSIAGSLSDELHRRVVVPPGFCICLHDLPASGQPPHRHIADAVKVLVSELPPWEEARALVDQGGQAPVFAVGPASFPVTISFHPLPERVPADPLVATGFGGTPGIWVPPRKRVLGRLTEKLPSGRNVVDLSYVIALVSADHWCTEQDVREAVFGTGTFGPAGHRPDGLLDGCRNRRISAVLWIPEWSISTKYLRRAIIYENPNAAHSLSSDLLPWRFRVDPTPGSHISGRGVVWRDRDDRQVDPDDLSLDPPSGSG